MVNDYKVERETASAANVACEEASITRLLSERGKPYGEHLEAIDESIATQSTSPSLNRAEQYNSRMTNIDDLSTFHPLLLLSPLPIVALLPMLPWHSA